MIDEGRRLTFDNGVAISPFPETEIAGIRYVAPSWNDMGKVCTELGVQIEASGIKFNRIIAVARGGLTWSRAMADALEIDTISLVGVKSYTGVNEATEPQITQPLHDSIAGESVLVVEDVADSGESLLAVLQHLEGRGASHVSVATLAVKPRSAVTPNFAGFQTAAWIVFPHEYKEFITLSAAQWGVNGLSEEAIRGRFLEIGIPDFAIDTYFKPNERR